MYVPLAVGFLLEPAAGLLDVLLLLTAATAAFVVHEPIKVALVRKHQAVSLGWVAELLTLVGVAGLWLLWRYPSLLWVALVDVALVGGYFGVLGRGGRKKRVDRTLGGQAFLSIALSSGVVAAMIVSGMSLGAELLLVWAWMWCFHTGGIFFVHMVLAAAKRKRLGIDSAIRTQLAAPALIFHAGLLAIALAAAWVNLWLALVLLVAISPSLMRMLVGWSRLSPTLPSLKKVGMLELAMSLWFGALTVLAWSAGGGALFG